MSTPKFIPSEQKPEEGKVKKDLSKILRESDERVRELFERQDPSRPCPPKDSPKAARRPAHA
jgi:hypothetical protein